MTDDLEKCLEFSLPSQLMAKPAMPLEEFTNGVLGLADSTGEQVIREDPAPRIFLIGRRRYILTEDAIAWLRELAEAKRYVPRRNTRRAA